MINIVDWKQYFREENKFPECLSEEPEDTVLPPSLEYQAGAFLRTWGASVKSTRISP